MVYFLTDLVSWLAMTGPTMPGMVAKVLVIPRRIPAYLQTQVHCLLNSSHFGAAPATASFKCRSWIYIKTRTHSLRSTHYCVLQWTKWVNQELLILTRERCPSGWRWNRTPTLRPETRRWWGTSQPRCSYSLCNQPPRENTLARSCLRG